MPTNGYFGPSSACRPRSKLRYHSQWSMSKSKEAGCRTEPLRHEEAQDECRNASNSTTPHGGLLESFSCRPASFHGSRTYNYAAPSRLRGRKAPKDGQQPCFTPKDRCHLSFTVMGGVIPPRSAFRGCGRSYTVAVRFLPCYTAALSLKKGFQAVLPNARYQGSPSTRTATCAP